jgi:uncharacterized membrane protein YecN with MAPEG domain
MNQVALVCTALLGLLLFLLGLSVSVARRRMRVGSGTDANPASLLHKLSRAHGNTAEYAPFFAVLFLYLGSRNPSDLVVWLIVAATICRFLLALGLVAWPTMARPNPARFIGALGTYVLGAALSIALLTTQ